ncbi:MAG: leucine-rich repeat domain-containing protein [Treponema sp.]|jgi:hypothetical protein|nr:leucine-rich repeat domain-containing protein [Treponema sp.]
MKQHGIFLPTLAAILLAVLPGAALVVISCAAAPDTAGETSETIEETNSAAETNNTLPKYWTGDGGNGLGIAILVPEGKDLADGEAYLPTLVQGVLVGDMTKFSAMKVLDRQNLEKVIAEGESGYYADESNFVQLGTVTKVQYVLNGSLQKTASGFSLQFKITDATSGSGASKAVYTGSCSAAELENLSGVKKASAELLAQMGINLTDAGKTSLLGGTTSNVQAETALARGITAQRSGTIVEALSYYYEAAKFDPGLAEAASRGSVLSADIQGGNIGQNVRNDIQARAGWNKTLQEATAFFKEHPPFELVYDPTLTQGKIDYTKETVDMSFSAMLIGTTGFKIIYDLDQGLEKTGKSREWGIGVDSIYRELPGNYRFEAILVNETGETIGRTTSNFNVQPYSDSDFRRIYDIHGFYDSDSYDSYDSYYNSSIYYYTSDIYYNFSHKGFNVVFSSVDANKISDRLTVSIISVNGMDAKTAGERGYMSISAEDFTALRDFPFNFNWWFGGIRIIETRGNLWWENPSKIIPTNIGHWPVTAIGERVFFNSNSKWNVTIPNSVTFIGEAAFAYNKFTNIVIPNSVTFIGAEAFANNELTSVTIPNSVTSIGRGAFTNNQLTSVTIPNSVTSIGSGAFTNNQLTSVTIPNSVTFIGAKAFAHNEFTNIVIPDSVTYIGAEAFANGKLTSITLPANVEIVSSAVEIRSEAFFYREAYEANGKKAGTYIYDKRSKSWRLK